jgi:hypothetical protein
MAPRLPPALAALADEARRLERLTDPRNLYAYCLVCAVD